MRLGQCHIAMELANYVDLRGLREISGLTNWMPVSLRIPIPAEAKLAPTSSLFPLSSGLKYGNVGSEPSASPEIYIHTLSQFN